MGIGWVWKILKDNTISILLILVARIVRFLEKKTKKWGDGYIHAFEMTSFSVANFQSSLQMSASFYS